MRKMIDDIFEHPQEVFDSLFYLAAPYSAFLLRESGNIIAACILAILWWYYYFIVRRRRDNYK